MKAVVCTSYGSADGLQLKSIAKPTPKAQEVLIKVHATTVTAGDVFVRKLTLPAYVFLWPIVRFGFGFKNLRKSILGHEFSGEIVAIGEEVKGFVTGDYVFGTTTGLSQGSYAEYISVPADGILAHKPSNMTFNQAAAVPVGGLTALSFLKKGNIQPGQKVLIYGASGSVGTYAVQVAKYFGAEVTAVCSTRNLELVQSIGADKVIDYTQEDFSKNGETYDVIFDAVGKISSAKAEGSLNEQGSYLTIKSIIKEKKETLIELKEMIESGKIEAVIDLTFPLDGIADAHRYVEKGHKRGNLVIDLFKPSQTSDISLDMAAETSAK